MVKELEITDRKPSEIAEMIAQEVSLLVPDWKAIGGSVDLYRVYTYKDDAAVGRNHHFCNLPSPTSSQGTVFGRGNSLVTLGLLRHHHQGEWFQGAHGYISKRILWT